MAAAFELLFNDAQSYPTGSYTTGAVLGSSALAASYKGSNYTLTPTYVGLIPLDPTPVDNGGGGCTASSAAYTSIGGVGPNAYYYTAPADGHTYTLTFCLGGNGSGSYGGGEHVVTPQGVQ